MTGSFVESWVSSVVDIRELLPTLDTDIEQLKAMCSERIRSMKLMQRENLR